MYSLFKRHPNHGHLQVYVLDLRLGNRSLIDALIRMKDSFNSYTIDRLALVGAQAAFEDEAYFKDSTGRILSTREKVMEKMKELGFDVLPSQANFIFASHPTYPAQSLYTELKKEGILVRYFDKEPIDNFLRITIGTDEQMEQFLLTLRKILSI